MTAPVLKIRVVQRPIIKGKMNVRFPANVDGDAFITVEKANGTYTFDADYTILDPTPFSSAANTIVAVWDAVSQSWKQTTVLALQTSAAVGEPVVVTASSAAIAAGTGAVAVNRSAPSATALSLPTVAAQAGLPLRIFDWSTSVTDHTITLTPSGSEKIMRQSTWPIYSNAASLGGVMLIPSNTLGGWYIAP